MPNTRVDVHLCNPVGTSCRGYRPRSASQWCTRRACWRAQDFFPRALHQHARLGWCRLSLGAKACRIRALMCTCVTQCALRSAGTALGLLRFGAHRHAGVIRYGGFHLAFAVCPGFCLFFCWVIIHAIDFDPVTGCLHSWFVLLSRRRMETGNDERCGCFPCPLYAVAFCELGYAL